MNLSVSNRFFHAAVDPLPALIPQNGQLIISYQRMNGFACHRFTEQDTGPACQPSPAHPVQQVKVTARVRYSRPGELIGGHLRQAGRLDRPPAASAEPVSRDERI